MNVFLSSVPKLRGAFGLVVHPLRCPCRRKRLACAAMAHAFADSAESDVSGTESESESTSPWSRDALDWVRQLPRRFPQQGHSVSLLLPCAGFDAAGMALEALKVQFSVAGAWDVEPGPGAMLRSRYEAGVVHTGPDNGDITTVHRRSIPDADGLVSGPPCPPWSPMGSRRGREDPRALAFETVLGWIRICSRRGALKFFVLENVVGIGSRAEGAPESDLERFLRTLRSFLPREWRVFTLRMDSHMVAQSRPRIYIVGHVAWEGCRNVEDFLPTYKAAELHDILLDLPNDDPRLVLSEKQRRNLRLYLEIVKALPAYKHRACKYALFEVDRDPEKTRAHVCVDQIAGCLRTSAQKYWVVSLWRSDPFPSVSRLLHNAERCRLQGIPPAAIPGGMSRNMVQRGLGNAMTVPVIGAVLNAVLLVIQPLLVSGRPVGRPPSDHSPPPRKAPRLAQMDDSGSSSRSGSSDSSDRTSSSESTD